MKQRCLTLLLVFMIVFQLLPAGATQAASDGSEDRAVNLLMALGVMGVDSSTGLFWDETPVRRGEMAEILCKLFGFEATSGSVPMFFDVGEKDRAYVETIVRNGYMSGYSDTRFGADDYITNEQLVKIFVTVIGGAGLAEREGGYPSGYIYVGKRLGITEGAVASLGNVSRRIDVASIIYDAINSDLIILSGMSGEDAIYTSAEGETFLTETLKIYRGSGILSKNEGTSLNRPDGAGEGMVQVGNVIYTDSKRLADDYLGCSVIVYAKKTDPLGFGDIVYIEEAKDNKTVLIEDRDIIGVEDSSITYSRDNKPQTLNVSYIADMVYNGKAISCDMSRADVKNGSVKLVDNNGDKVYDVVIVTEYETFIVDRVDTDEEKLLLKFDEPAIELENTLYRVFRDGKAAELENIGMGEVILAAISENNDEEKVVRIEASSLCVMGSVSKTRVDDGKTYITVAGEEYKISDYYLAIADKNLVSEIKAGDSGQFFIDARGAVVFFSKNSGDGGVGYLIDTSFEDNVFSAALSVKLYTLDKNIEVYKTADKITVNGEKMDVSDVRNSAEILGRFNEPQLVKYSVSEGVLTEITFAADGYDLQNFSRDIKSQLTCTCTSVLDDKYYVSANTKVFYVPDVSSDRADYQTIINNAAYYNIYTGSYFAVTGKYNVTLFDIEADGSVGYALIMSDPKWTNISEGTAMLAVTEVSDGIDDEGNLIKIVKGMNENGAEAEFKAFDSDVITDASLMQVPKMGDVIQYSTNSSGYIRGIKIQHSADEISYYTPTSISADSNCRTKKVFGEVISNGGTRMLLSCKSIWANMSPVDADKHISNTGKAIYRYDRDRSILYKAEFDEIERGDKVFACVSGTNKTRMLIIYE